MGSDILDPGRKTGLFECHSDSTVGNVGFSMTIWEQVLLVFVALPEFPETMQGCWRYWYQTLAIAFADDRQVACCLVNMAGLDPDSFAEP